MGSELSVLDPREWCRVRIGRGGARWWDEGGAVVVVVVGVCADEEGGMLRVEEPWDIWGGRVGAGSGRGNVCSRSSVCELRI